MVQVRKHQPPSPPEQQKAGFAEQPRKSLQDRLRGVGDGPPEGGQKAD
jgi:hypothetical protein